MYMLKLSISKKIKSILRKMNRYLCEYSEESTFERSKFRIFIHQSFTDNEESNSGSMLRKQSTILNLDKNRQSMKQQAFATGGSSRTLALGPPIQVIPLNMN